VHCKRKKILVAFKYGNRNELKVLLIVVFLMKTDSGYPDKTISQI